jgi:preprotein translocase subunit SecF
MRFFANASYPFLDWRRRAYVVSAALLLFGIAAMAFNTVRTGAWLNYGIDFAGGTLVQVEFDRPMQVDEIRSAVASEGLGTWQITRFGADNEYVVRLPTFDETVTQDPALEVERVFETNFQDVGVNIVRTEAVGPTVGAELQQRALLAILISFLATLIYVAVRFEWRFGVASVIATAHDILIALGFLALLRMEISIGTVAAFLTIVGYSLNDTIVVFDLVRENMTTARRRETHMETLNRSINETLPRTVLTSGTTLLTLFSLYLFGGAVIRDFALVLILGIVIGTYSSIFVAAPALNAIEAKWPRQEKKRSSAATKRPRSASAV